MSTKFSCFKDTLQVGYEGIYSAKVEQEEMRGGWKGGTQEREGRDRRDNTLLNIVGQLLVFALMMYISCPEHPLLPPWDGGTFQC